MRQGIRWRPPWRRCSANETDYRRTSDAGLLHATENVPAAFEAFFVRHQPHVLQTVRRLDSDLPLDAVLDLATEVFATAYLDRSGFDHQEQSAEMWLTDIARGKVEVFSQRADAALLDQAVLGIGQLRWTDAARADASALMDRQRRGAAAPRVCGSRQRPRLLGKP